jgi:hypothetical protein
MGDFPKLAPQFTYGTTPPTNPQDGDQWVFPADTANGVMWQFRYRAGSPNAEKWEFIGGPPAFAYVATAETTTTVTTWLDLPTVGPRIILARGGVYDAVGAAMMWHSVAAQTIILGIWRNATVQADGSQMNVIEPVANGALSLIAQARATCVAGDDLRHRYYSGGAGTMGAQFRWLRVTPVRVS